jgi:PAS domain-containing protein
MFPQAVTNEFYPQYHKAMRERVPVHFEGRSGIAEGSWFEMHVYPTEEGLAVYFRDITERKRVEEKLRRSEAHLAEAQRIGHIGSWIWDVATGDCFWPQEHFHIFGLDPETFKPTKENTQRLIHPEDLPSVEQTLESAIRERSNFEMDYRIVGPDGSIRYHRGMGHPLVRESSELEFVGMKQGGLGLGLSISRTIVEAHGGRLWATPNEGPGATFQFTLPTGSEREIHEKGG